MTNQKTEHEVMAGIHHDSKAVNWALAVLGEPVNV